MEYLHGSLFFQPTSLRNVYGSFNIKVAALRVLITSNMITYIHFFMLFLNSSLIL